MDAKRTIGSVAWQNISAISQADGNSVVLNSSGKDSQCLVAYGFSITIPINASIRGIIAYFYRKATSWDGACDNSLRIIQDRMITGTDHAVTLGMSDTGPTAFWPTSWILASYGSSSDLWGLTWTPSQIDSKFFGVAISAWTMAGEAYIDYVEMQVYYSTDSGRNVRNQTSTCGSALEVPGYGGQYLGLQLGRIRQLSLSPIRVMPT